ncbi:hypothetical protein VTO58DRAFT_109146 [Aureobasidium pullulans]|nr:hypothetical protein JADG_009020 [Aureobasidium pullulans]
MANIMHPHTLALATVAGQGLKTPTTTSSRKARKVCRLTKWLTSAQAKLRTTISRPAKSIPEKSCYPISSKRTQQRRIHNEVFGWTSDAFDEMSMISSSPSYSRTTLTSPSPSKSSTDTKPREQLLKEADDAMISRLENTFTNGTNRHPRGRKSYLRIEGY